MNNKLKAVSGWAKGRYAGLNEDVQKLLIGFTVLGTLFFLMTMTLMFKAVAIAAMIVFFLAIFSGLAYMIGCLFIDFKDF